MTKFLFLIAVGIGIAGGALASDKPLRVAIPNRIVTLNPVDTVIAQDRFVLPLIFEYLVEADSFGEIKNRLVSKWTFDKAARKLVFIVSPNHKFSDGSEVTADSIENAFRIICRPGSNAVSQFIGLVGCGEGDGKLGVSAVGERVEFQISIDPNAFLYQLAYGRGPIFKLDSSKNAIGSGPYKVEKCFNETCKLIKNEFSKTDTKFSAIQFVHLEPNELESAFTKREVDVASMFLESTTAGISRTLVATASHSPNVTQTLVINPTKAPFNSLSFRSAFKAKIDALSFKDCGIPGRAHGLIPLGIPGSLPRLENSANSQKIEKVNAEVLLYRHVGRKNECEERKIIAAGATLGVTIKFEHLSNYKDLLAKYRDSSVSGYIELIPFVFRDPSPVLRRFMPNSSDGFYYYSSRPIQELIDQALRQPSIGERISTYQEINREINRNASVIPLYYASHTVLFGKCVRLNNMDTLSFNPNSFLYLLDLSEKSNCEATK